MKRIGLNFIIVAFSISAAFTSCKKDDDDSPFDRKITATVENGSDYNSKIDVVKLVTLAYNPSTDDKDEIVLAIGSYSNGGFMIKLPSKVDDKYLHEITQSGIHSWQNLSNSAKILDAVWIQAYKNEEYVGVFVYGNRDIDAGGHFLYTDRDLTMTGSGKQDEENAWTETFNYSYIKGWNWWYVISDNDEKTHTYTTLAPNSLKWYLYLEE